MTKTQKIKKYFNQKEKLTLKNGLYFDRVKRYLLESINDDLNKTGDITTNLLIKKNTKTKAFIIAKENGILAGMEEISWLLRTYGLGFMNAKKDGQTIKKGQIICTLHGGVKNILKLERTILNTLQRMSGIATETNQLVKKTKNKILLCSTRKTPLGILDKKAVVVGGGGTHRLGLYDWILIKDNHLETTNHNLQSINSFWEIEVKNEKEFKQALSLKPGAIMLDNMSPAKIENLLKKYKKYKNIIIEASGGINKKNIIAYSQTGVDIISLGCLTHSAKALDLSLKI